MGRCNYCKLKKIKEDAKKRNKAVTVLADASWGVGGLNVYVHLPSVKINKLEGGEDGERAKYRWLWMKELGKHCSC